MVFMAFLGCLTPFTSLAALLSCVYLIRQFRPALVSVPASGSHSARIERAGTFHVFLDAPRLSGFKNTRARLLLDGRPLESRWRKVVAGPFMRPMVGVYKGVTRASVQVATVTVPHAGEFEVVVEEEPHPRGRLKVYAPSRVPLAVVALAVSSGLTLVTGILGLHGFLEVVRLATSG